MATTEPNISENGTSRKPRWKRPKAKKKYTEAEIQRIEATRAVLQVIREMKEEGVFDEIQSEEISKI